MAFDGITIANIVKELKESLLGGRIYKIAQPETDELLLTIKTREGQKKLFLSANASLPLIYLTDLSKPSPMTAPSFCMLLRKHLQNGRIVDISQPGLERIVHITAEHLDELGDLRRKTLVMEIMGKHSNIIFCNEDNMIVDSIKHISGMVSSVREVLPGKPYVVPRTQDKKEPLTTDYQEFHTLLSARPCSAFKAVYSCYTGISPVLAQELCYEAGIDGEQPTAALTEENYRALYQAFDRMTGAVKNGDFSPGIAYTGTQPVEFASIPLTMYTHGADRTVPYASISSLLETYYAEKNTITRIRQKSSDLRRIVQTALERNVKKYDLQLRQIKDTEKRDTYRIYGELLNTYGYNAQPGSKSLEALNYYTNETIIIPLDPDLTPSENAKKYFEKYNKMKRTYEALTELTREVKAEIDHLESIGNALDIALLMEEKNSADVKQSTECLSQIREELVESGYLKGSYRRDKIKGQKMKEKQYKGKAGSKPFHYISSDGFHIYVGKNNYQNEEITFKFASGNDWWFHAKGMPGSHVVLKADGDSEGKHSGEIPDRTFEEAGRLAAYYSQGRGQDKVEIDYIQRKHVKKPSGAKPGFVVYYTNYSLIIDSDITGIRLAESSPDA